MGFNRILVVESIKQTENHFNSINNIREVLDRRGENYNWINYNELSDFFGKQNKDLKTSFAGGHNIDLIVSVGGDGVFIRVSHFVRDTLLLGINSDVETSEGALKEISANELNKFESILEGDYNVRERTRARVIRNGEFLKELALNEVYVGVNNQFHTSRYIIGYAGYKEEQRSSGILVATGTGSGAWYKSAGGKIFAADENKLKFLVREPFCGKLFNPRILNGELGGDQNIVFRSKRRTGGVVVIDSSIIYPFNSGDLVEVRVCHQKLRVVVPLNLK